MQANGNWTGSRLIGKSVEIGRKREVKYSVY